MTSSPTERPSRIFLTGMMGAGKSTVGRLVASMMKVPFIDLDEEIAAAAEATVAQVIRDGGIERFRVMEREALLRCGGGAEFVMATGGGVVEDGDNRRFMRERGIVVYLEAPARLLAERLRAEAGLRPLLDGGGHELQLDRLIALRGGWYAEAELVVDAGGSDAEAVARVLIERLERKA